MGNRIGSLGLIASVALLFFAIGAVSAYQPIAGLVIVAGLGFLVAYYAKPAWFANAVVFITCFAGLLHLPVTSDGFSSAVAIALPGVVLQVVGMMVRKDRRLLGTFADRFDQLLPLVMMVAMLISVKNVRELGPAIRQVQQWVYIVAIFYFILLIVNDRRSLHGVVLAFLIGGFIVEIIGLMEGVFKKTIYDMTGQRSLFGADLSTSFLQVEEAGRINGPLGDAPFHGMFCTVTAALSFYELFTTRRKLVKALCVLVFLLTIYNVMGTGSRGALLALALAIFTFWLAADIRNKAAYALGGGLVFVAMVGLMVAVMTAQTGEARSLTYNSDTSETAEMRIKNFPVAMKMFGDYPIFGIGPDGFVTNFSRYAVGVSNLASRQKVLKTHDTPAQVLAENGLVGLSIFLGALGGAMAVAASVARRSRDRRFRLLGAALLAALVAYTFFMLTSNSLLDKFLWTLIAFVQALGRLSRAQDRALEAAASAHAELAGPVEPAAPAPPAPAGPAKEVLDAVR